MHAARLEQKRQKRELGGSMANAGTVEGPETLFLTGCLAGKFDLLSISLLEAKACYKGGILSHYIKNGERESNWK